MIEYILVKFIFKAHDFVKVILNTIVQYYGLSISIMIDYDLVFISKFCSLLYYFLKIKQKLSTTYYLQINVQTK